MKFMIFAGGLAAAMATGTALAQSSPSHTERQTMSANSTTSTVSDTEKRQRAGDIMRQMLPPESVAAMQSSTPGTQFGGEFAKLAYENAYVSLWGRPGLGPKERSILTIGILIGVGNERELRSHIAGGLRNGLTPNEIEEIIYHATAYAGFPAASSALAVAAEVVEQQQK